MKQTIRQRLERQRERFEEIGRMLADPHIDGGSREFRDLSMEYARLTALAERYTAFVALEQELSSADALAADADPQMRALGDEERDRKSTRLNSSHSSVSRMPSSA